MKIIIRILSLGCLATLALLFAVSTPAQKFPIPRHAPSAQAAGTDASALSKSEMKSRAASPNATQTCTYQFTSGSGTTYLQFCVSVNGNIVEFQSPAGVEQLDQGGAYEGYGICDTTTETGYYDYAYASTINWNSPITLAHTATMVRIERTTTDGTWTLTQTITSSAGPNPYAKIAMALKNNSSLAKGVYLYRYANPDPDDAVSTDNFAENYDGTAHSAWGYGAFGSDSPYGLMIQNIGNPTPPPATLYSLEGFAISGIFGPPNPCNIHSSTTIYNGEGSTMFFYDMTLDKEKTVTVTDRYISF